MKVDVITSVFEGTNLEHWKESVSSFYQVLPINRFLIGNMGCRKEIIDVAMQYPNLVVFDQRDYKSLGYSLRKLIEAIDTEYFVYVHPDVVLPENWFTEMQKHVNEYDWFESNRVPIFPKAMRPEVKEQLKAEFQRQFMLERAYSGSQIGKTTILKHVVKFIDDDYIIRTEDLVIQHILQKLGYKYGKVNETCHYHFIKPTTQLKPRDRIQTILAHI